MKNAKRRSLWRFTCNICGSPDHQTLVRKRAKKGVCLKCAKIDPRQIIMFDSGFYQRTRPIGVKMTSMADLDRSQKPGICININKVL